MNTSDILSEGDLSIDLNSQISDATSSLSDMLAPFIWLSFALTIVFIALYIMSMVRRRKLENAILDMQNVLHEMNERDKARSTAPRLPKADDDRIIAKADEPALKP